MTAINLLPWRETERREKNRDFLWVSLFICAVLFSIMLVMHLHLVRKLHREQVASQYLHSELMALDAKNTQVQAAINERNALIRQMEVITYLQTNRARMIKIFAEVARALPSGVYLTLLEKTANKIVLAGRAEADTQISQFMKNLNESAVFKTARLTEILSEGKLADSRKGLQQFKLTMQVSLGNEGIVELRKTR